VIGFWRILILLTIVPIAELFLLLEVGSYIGTMRTILLVLVTGVVGATFASREEAAAIGRIRGDLREGQIPSNSILDAGIVLVGGALLITPGLMTDVIGFLCMFASTRTMIRNWVKRKIARFFWSYL